MPRRSLLVALLLARARASCPAIAPAARLDCGYVNISEALCASRGCCFDAAAANGTGLAPTDVPRCYFGGGGGVPIRRVHVVIANHFDAGYTNLTASSADASDFARVYLDAHGRAGYRDARVAGDVIDEYFHRHFATAAEVGAAWRAAGGGGAARGGLAWMTQPWLVSLFLECPPGLGFACPNATERAGFRAAVDAGDITWHAFAHNAQLSLGSADLLEDLARCLLYTSPSPRD